MADKSPLDPAALVRAFLSAWEPGTATPGAPAVEHDTPAERLMAQALAAANMPSRREIGDIAVRLDRIEAALARLEQRLDTAVAPSADGKRKRKR